MTMEHYFTIAVFTAIGCWITCLILQAILHRRFLCSWIGSFFSGKKRVEPAANIVESTAPWHDDPSELDHRASMVRFIDALESLLNGSNTFPVCGADAPGDDPYRGSVIGDAFDKIGIDSKSKEAMRIVSCLIHDGHLRLIDIENDTLYFNGMYQRLGWPEIKPKIGYHYIPHIDDNEPPVIGHLVNPSYI